MVRWMESEGWIWIRTRGSHRQFVHPLKPGRVTVSGNMGKEMPIGLERAIRRQAGLGRRP